MQVDEQALLQTIGANPMIRTVQLADKMNCDIADIDDILLALSNRGRVVGHPVTAPNNRKATGYTLSEGLRQEILHASPGVSIDTCAAHIERAIAFIRQHETVTGAQLHAFLGLEPSETPSQFLAEALADARLFKDGKHWTLGAASRCAQAGTPAPALASEIDSMVAKALAFIAESGAATDQQLRKVMGIGKEAPASYLATEVREGRMHKTSWHWKAGPRPAGAVPAFRITDEKGVVAQFGPDARPEEAIAPPSVTVTFIDPAKPVPYPPEPEGTHSPEPAKPFPTASFRCGLWSDGVLEICRDGKVIAALSPDERTQVEEFLKRAA